MNERRRAFLKELLYVIGDERWDLIVNDYHKGGDDFDYAIVRKGHGISMNRIHLGDLDYFGMYLEDYETPDVQDGIETYGEVYEKVDDENKKAMLDAVNQAIIDELINQDQYGDDDEGDNVYSTAFYEEEGGR